MQRFNKMNYPGSKYAYYQRKTIEIPAFNKQAFFKKAKKIQDIGFAILSGYFCLLLLIGEIQKHITNPQPTTQKQTMKKPVFYKKPKVKRRKNKS